MNESYSFISDETRDDGCEAAVRPEVEEKTNKSVSQKPDSPI